MEGAVQVKGDVEPRDLSKTKQEVTVTKMLYSECVLVLCVGTDTAVEYS